MKFCKKYQISLAIILALFIIILLQSPAQASFMVGGECLKSGDCSVCDLIQVVINVGTFIFAIVGAIALLFLVIGGFFMLISAGESAKIAKGKKIMVNSIIGLLITLSAYSFVVLFVGIYTSGFTWEASLKCSVPAPALPGAPCIGAKKPANAGQCCGKTADTINPFTCTEGQSGAIYRCCDCGHTQATTGWKCKAGSLGAGEIAGHCGTNDSVFCAAP
jgi:hypothetical protein